MTAQQAPAQIAIVGAGPCGLTLARLLEKSGGGVDYIVYDRDAGPTANTAGGSLDLHPGSGQRALQDAGLFDEFKRFARYEDTVFSIRDTHGVEQLKVGEGRDAPEIDRRQLRDILLASVPPEKIRWGHTLASTDFGSDGKPVLKFENGIKVSGFQLVIGTDGAWSKVRSLITPATPVYTGRSYVETRIQPGNPHYALATELLGRGSTTAIGNSHVLVAQKQGDASYRLYWGFPMPEHTLRRGSEHDLANPHKVEVVRDMLLEDGHYGTWADCYRQLIANATDFRGWPLYSLPAEGLATTDNTSTANGERSRGWTTVSGATLAGDAAHLTPPNGEGVNLAMKDAMDLADKINSWGSLSVEKRTQDALDAAVQEYEAVMLASGVKSVKEGAAMTDIMFAESHEPFVELLNSFVAMAKQGGGEH